MRQRLALAQAVMEDPDILLLDEPFNALDDATLQSVVQILGRMKERGKCIVIASHVDPLEGTGLPDRVIVMENGRITA